MTSRLGTGTPLTFFLQCIVIDNGRIIDTGGHIFMKIYIDCADTGGKFAACVNNAAGNLQQVLIIHGRKFAAA